jgi:hypothetical protein
LEGKGWLGAVSMGWRRGSLFLNLSQQPSLGRGSCQFLLGMVISETAGPEDDGAPLGGAGATSLKCRAGASHPVGARLPVSWQAMPAAQMQEGADKAMAAVSVIIMAARPVAVVGKMIEHQVEQLHRLHDLGFQHWFDRSRSG